MSAHEKRQDMAMKRDQCSYVAPVRTSSRKLGKTSAVPTARRVAGTSQKSRPPGVRSRAADARRGSERWESTMATIFRVRYAADQRRHALDAARLLTTQR